MKLRFAAFSDVGRVRRDNQDSGYAGPQLLAVADGVGGAARGDVASSTAIAQLRLLDQATQEADPAVALREALDQAHTQLTLMVAEDPGLEGTSTTVTAGLVHGDNLHVAHIGDSRGYLLRDGELQQLTSDHSFVQSLIDEGRITEEEARVHPNRNLILRALDGARSPNPDLSVVELQPGDRLLFCSDGCCGSLDGEEVAGILGQGSADAACVALVNAALDAGSTDNVTVVIGDVLPDDAPDDPDAAAAIGPMLVGAAGEQARRDQLSGTGSIPPVAGSSEGDAALDPEEARYALRAPRRFGVLRRLLVAALVLLLVGLGAFFSYRWTQQQYFVAFDDSDDVAIFQGVNFELPGLPLHHVEERTALSRDELSKLDQRNVDAGIGVADLDAARRQVEQLASRTCTPDATMPTPSPTLTPTPNPTLTSSPTPAPVPTASTNPDCGDQG
ncbi:MAG TPA: protein phosphatase 2C domain-containing protein [Marmoricola sp.]|nr:protein phosphatase 2C domain-containing protein [Marmoricola sp.]